MAATLKQVDSQVVTALREGDEHALERVFYERFPALLELARADVPDAARASRALVNVFLRAWQERAHLDSPASLDAMLDKATHEAARREKGRMASLHRFEAHEGVKTQHKVGVPPTLDEVWGEVKGALHGTTANHAEMQHQRQSLSKHHAAEHMAAIGKKSSLPMLALGGVVALSLALLAVFFWIPSRGLDGRMTRALANVDTREISTNSGQRGNVKLDDGTQVTLGADSRLRVPPSFPVTLRVVALNGTATFNVQPGSALPFYLRVGRATVEVTGTVFAVSSYAGDERTLIRVREGTIKVSAGSEEQEVSAGNAVSVDDDGISTPSTSELSSELSWIDGRMVITDLPIEEVIPLLRRWYQLDVTVAEKSLLERRVSWSAGLDSANAAKTAMETNASVLFDYDGKKWVLRDVTKKK